MYNRSHASSLPSSEVAEAAARGAVVASKVVSVLASPSEPSDEHPASANATTGRRRTNRYMSVSLCRIWPEVAYDEDLLSISHTKDRVRSNDNFGYQPPDS